MRVVVVWLSVCLVACGGGAASMDGGRDAGLDAGSVDAGPPVDAAIPCTAPVLPPLAATDFTGGAQSFGAPVFLAQVPGDDDAFYVVERAGRVRIFHAATRTTTTFLDIRAAITPAPGGYDEYGLLGLAFHPDYATNGRFFVAYSTVGAPGSNRVAEYRRSASDPYVADGAEVARLVETADPEANHDGGWLAFGPDGFLYTTIGDGGGGCDAHGSGDGNGQDTSTLFGKLLRLDVDATATGYAAAGNPFSGASGLPQIWAYGLRNAWRGSFDRATGDLFLGDVGQNAWEELDFQAASSRGGENYGWRAYEGTHRATTASSCGDVAALPAGTVMPIVEYPHPGVDPGTTAPFIGRVVVGGYVYRGSAIPELRGVYLYGDGATDDVAALRYCDGAVHGHVAVPELRGAVVNISSFAEDNHGELYLMGIASGEILRIVRAP